jgi:hypothetical protein
MPHPTTQLAEKILVSLSHGQGFIANREGLVDTAWDLARKLHDKEREELTKLKSKEPKTGNSWD